MIALHTHLCRKIAVAIAVAAAAASILVGCNDDLELRGNIPTEEVTFSVKVSDQWQAIAGRSHSTDPSTAAIIHEPGMADTIYITATSDRIPTPTGDDESGVISRGKPITDQSDLSPLGVYAYTENGNTMLSDGCYTLATDDNAWRLQSANALLWPADGSEVTFFAYAPQRNDASSVSFHFADATLDKGYFEYQILGTDDGNGALAVNPAEMQDFLVADRCSYNKDSQSPQLNFKHALTSFTFTTGGKFLPSQVKKIRLDNVGISGQYRRNSLNGAWSWEDVITGSIAWEPDITVDPVTDDPQSPDDLITGTSDVSLNGGTGEDAELFTIMLIPTNGVTASARADGGDPAITLTIIDKSGKEWELTAPLAAAKSSTPGQALTFNISTTRFEPIFTFSITQLPNTHDGEVQTHPITGEPIYYAFYRQDILSNEVTSYYRIFDKLEKTYSDPTPLTWKLSDSIFYYETGDTTNQIYDAILTNPVDYKWETQPGNGKIFDRTTIIADPDNPLVSKHELVVAETSSNFNPGKIGNDVQGDENNPIDLSLTNGQRNTANCYVVNSPGFYMIPAVYGNAIKDGAVNPDAYTYSGTDTYVLRKFLRHDNQEIESPWIFENNFEGADNPSASYLGCYVPNEDADNNYIYNVEVIDVGDENESHKFIRFNLAQNSLWGLYVIAAKVNNQIVWSWTIWVTPETNANRNDMPTVSYGGKNYLQCDLGSDPDNKIMWRGKKIVMTYTQDISGETAEVILYKARGFDHHTPSSILYQHGRKDPLRCQVGSYETQNHFNPDGKISIWLGNRGVDFKIRDTDFEKVSGDGIGYSIKRPDQKPISAKGYSGEGYTNLWNNGTADAPIKTVYDPCPVGFIVPPTADFSEANPLGDYTNKPIPPIDEIVIYETIPFYPPSGYKLSDYMYHSYCNAFGSYLVVNGSSASTLHNATRWTSAATFDGSVYHPTWYNVTMTESQTIPLDGWNPMSASLGTPIRPMVEP